MIYDRSYYLNTLKAKNIELKKEINKFTNEVEQINKDNNQYMELERKYDGLIREVRKFEGELADYNLALDKHRTDTKTDCRSGTKNRRACPPYPGGEAPYPRCAHPVRNAPEA